MPSYANFNDAWSEWAGMYSSVANEMSWFNDDLGAVLSSANWAKLRTNTYRCLAHLRNAFIAHVSPGGFGADAMDSSHYASTYYAWSEVPDVDVSMDAILSAMITAELEQLQKFVGLVDAYRVALWNKPFNADFYAALARGFM